ncbi:MAG: Molybdenum cofactor guanylyltransferase [Verrucomicrobia subdivision 3 bacterium]|nr:Molybdenum cofactor guanylyltransferase [Limisphaerales bacterium]MCS1416762.1 Molybdenum cofactor guanylyltransferase [Limisphaerales bacterium]
MNASIKDVRAVILAGGQSRRMGEAKASMPLLGRPLIDWVIQAVSMLEVPSSVIWDDFVPGLGPLGGVRTAFKRFPEAWFVFLSCDMPFLSKGLLNSLVQSKGQSAVFYAVDGRISFPFLLTRRYESDVTENLDLGMRSVRQLSDRLQASQISAPQEDQWRFLNVNTRRDLEEAERLAASRETLF